MRLFALLLLSSLALAACSSVKLGPAPVVRSNFTPAEQIPSPGTAGGPNSAFAGQPGYYTVQPGDTLLRIALHVGQSWRDLQRWNGLTNPNVIEVGQVLRVAPPAGAPGAQPASSPAAGTAVAQAVPLASRGGEASAPRAPAPAPAPVPAPAVPAAASAAAGHESRAVAALSGHGPIRWQWPAAGRVLQGFNGGSSKGLDIAGKLDAPVLAAAAGKVVYAGNQLRGFGNLIIVKHDADYISVYAHNAKLLVKEGAMVRRGQTIALMGSTDAQRVELHFEIRLHGKPVDPTHLLPAR